MNRISKSIKTQLKAGMFVTVANDDSKGRVYVVGSIPVEEAIYPEWRAEFIPLDYIDETYRYRHTHYHITKIHPYEGDIPSDHPLRMLGKIAKGKLKIKKKIWERIIDGRILLDHPEGLKSWRNIPALQEHRHV